MINIPVKSITVNMPLSPNSDPSLISQVREILSDSRNDYLKRQQLFQDNEQAQARLGLGYAQLAAQRENQALDADIKRASIQQSAASDFAKLEQLQNNANIEQARANYTLNKDAAKQDLDERKFEFDRQKEKREADLEANKYVQDQVAGASLAEFARYAANNDQAGMKDWYNKQAINSNNIANFGQVMTQASNITDAMQKSAQAQRVQVALPELNKVFEEGSQLQSRLSLMSPDERDQAIASLRQKSLPLLSLPDVGVRDGVTTLLTGLDNARKVVEENAATQQLDEFYLDGRDGKLAEISPALQNQFDDMIARTPETERDTEAFATQKRRLFLDRNKILSTSTLAREANALRSLEEAQLSNPEFTITDADGTVRPKWPAPNLAPSYSAGVLDRNNLISPRIEKEIVAYKNKLQQVGVVRQQEDPLAALAAFAPVLSGENKKGGKPVVPQVEPTAPVANRKMALGNTWAFSPPAQTNQEFTPEKSPASAMTPAEQPKADTTDYRKNYALLNEVDRQIKAGNTTYVENGKPTNINLNTLRNRIQSRMGQRIVGTFNPPPAGIVGDLLTPPLGTEEPTGEVAE